MSDTWQTQLEGTLPPRHRGLLIQYEMEHVAEFSVPIVAELGLGPNWRDIK